MSASAGVVLIYTNSYDSTCDLLVSRLGTEKVFRFNFDLWRDYKITITPQDFSIENPTGRRIGPSDVTKFYWRKPMRRAHMFPDADAPRTESYLEEELWYAVREVVNTLWAAGKVVLVEPFGDLRAGKMVQAAIAKAYFHIPPFKFASGAPDAFQNGRVSVAKSLTSSRVAKGAVLYASRVSEGELDPTIPWMIQDLVEADKDITIAFVRDELFAFELLRAPFIDRTVDWREVSLETISHDWPVHELPPAIRKGVFAFMHDIGLQYGRIDMLYAKGEYYFLEVNSNGEWGWLDVEGKHGILGKILEEVSPDTAVHALPFNRNIQFPKPC